MWLSCSVENAALKASPPHRRRVQRPAQRARFVWVLSLTTRAADHLNLMDPTYAVITMPTSCQLWCGEALCFWEMQLCRVDPSQSTTSHHLKGATQVNASLLLWDHLIKGWGSSHWHLIVKTEYIKIRGHPSPGQIKAYLLGLDRPHTKSVGSCSLVDFRGLSRQKGIRKISKLFALQSWHCLV